MNARVRRSVPLLPCLCALIALTAPDSAQADGVRTAIGTPGTLGWERSCGEWVFDPGTGAISLSTDGLNRPIDRETGWENGGGDATSQLEPCESSDPLECMHLVEIDTDTYPNAVCSDGSPGAFYVRPGIGEDTNRWVIHLQGGGRCEDYETCKDRWCGEQGVYSAAKMSSDWDGNGVTNLLSSAEGLGMALIPDPTDPNDPVHNEFATWTHVFVYYCSSDSWMGRATDVTFTNEAGTKSFEMSTRGHTILAIMRKLLRRNGPLGTSWVPDPLQPGECDPLEADIDSDLCMPDLDAAEEILFTGTSAGALGAIQNADWFLSLFPNAKTGLVLDGNITIPDAILDANDITTTEYDDPEHPATSATTDQGPHSDFRATTFGDQWEPGGYYDQIDAFVDETCADYQGNTFDLWHSCTHIAPLLEGYGLDSFGFVPLIETDTFIRFDLQDSTVSKNFTQHPNTKTGWSLFNNLLGDETNLDDFIAFSREALIGFFDNAEPVSGVFAPRCSTHVGLELNGFFFDTTKDAIVESGGIWFTALLSEDTAHDILVEWFNPGGTIRPRRRIDAPTTTFSTCN